MPVKNMGPVRSKLKAVFEEITGPMTEKCLTTILIIGGGYADALTPMDLGTLVNSRFRLVEKVDGGWQGRYGYTAEYAKWVHEMPGTLRGQPRAHFGVTSNRSEFGPKMSQAFGGGSETGNYWDSSLGSGKGEPQWLTKGFERDGLVDIKAAILQEMKL